MKKRLLSIMIAAFFLGSFQQANAQAGAALNFAGGQYVNVPDNTNLNFGTGDFTIEAYFQSSASQPNYAGIVVKDGSGSGLGWQLVIVNNNIAAEFTDGATFFGASNGLQGSVVLTDGNWHHLAMVVNRSSSSIILYVDGTIDGSVSDPAIATMNISNTSVPMLFGVERTLSLYANGNIDEVKVWNIARTQTQIQNYMNCTLASNTTGLAAYYNFNNGIPDGTNTGITTVPDLTSNANNGTLNNFTLTGTASNFVANATPIIAITGISGVNAICSGTTTTLTATGNATTYTWSANAGSATTASVSLSPNSTDTYTVTGTDGVCVVTNTISINVTTTPTVGFSGDSSICSGTTTTLTAHGATSYTWASSAGTTTVSVIPVPPLGASITFTLTGANGTCSNETVGTITVNPTPHITISSLFGNVTCIGNTVGLTANGASSYTWSANAGGVTTSTVNITPSATDTYTITGTTGACTSSKTITITVNPLPTVSVNSTTVCAGTTTTLTASGTAASYNWSTGDATASVTETPTLSTTYTVTGTGANNCVNTATAAVTVNSLPTVAVNSTTVCAGTTTTLTASGTATSYSWSTGDATASVTETPTLSATYTVTGTDANNCSDNAIGMVSVNSLPTLSVNSASVCAGATTTTLTASGTSTSYSWSTGDATASITETPTLSATYTVTGTDANNCVNSAIAIITVNSLPTVSVNSPTVCVGTTFTLTGTGATTYSWSTGDVTTSITPSPTTSVSYTVTGTDANNCVDSATAMVTVNSLPTVAVNSSTVCAGITTTLTASGTATSYSWSTGDATASITPSPTTSVNYTVTGTDANNCSDNATAVVTVNSLPTLSVNSASVCAGATTTTLTASGTSTSYSWSTGDATASITETPTLSATYTVTGTDANNCMNSAVAMITVNSLPTISVNSATVCVGTTFTLTGTGATTYSWSTGDVTTSITPSPTTSVSYTVTGTDANNCVDSATAMVTVNSLPTVLVNSTTVCAGTTTTLTASGTATSYSWSTGDATASITPSPTTSVNYTVTGTDANNCSDNATAVVTVNSLPTLSVNSASVCAGATTTLTVSGTSTSYTWSTGDNTTSITETPTLSATYTVTGTGTNNCVNSAIAIITVNPLPSNSVTIAGDVLTATNASATYQWIDCGTHTAVSGATGQTYTAVVTGNYEVVLTETGCVDTSACNMVTVTGINTYVNNQGVSMYPNPASDALFIQTTTSFENATIEMYDMIGQKVLVEKVRNNLTKISLDNLINAVYQIRVISNNTLIYQNRVVKQQ